MLTIGKLAKHCQVNVETIRYYQRIGLMRIPETSQNYRYYSQQDIETLSFIQKGKDAGYNSVKFRIYYICNWMIAKKYVM